MKTMSSSISSVFKCDCGCGTEVSEASAAMPSGWKSIPGRKSPNFLVSPIGEKQICAACLASSDPETMAKIIAMIHS